MSMVAIDMAMQHLRAEPYDQNYVQLLLDAAEQSAQDFMSRKVFVDADAMGAAVLAGEAGDDPTVINPAIQAACLLILGNLYANREDIVVGVTAVELPMGSRALLAPYRVGMGV